MNTKPEVISHALEDDGTFPNNKSRPLVLYKKAIIMDGVISFIGTELCDQSLCNEKFYDWTGAGPIFDENFDGIRILMEAQGISLENIGE